MTPTDNGEQAAVVLWHCMTPEGIQRFEGDDLAVHIGHSRCVRERHVETCRRAGLWGDYACHGECVDRGAFR
jgi:hypothetical protein